MTSFAGLFRLGAIASGLSAATTAILIYGPSAETLSDLSAQAAQHDDPLYLYKPWILFFHPQFAFLASLSAVVALFKRAPALTSFGLFYLAVWAITEMTQQAYTIDALNQFWRPAYLAAENPADEAAYFAMLKGFSGVSDSLYFVLLFGFGAGSVLLGAAFLSSDRFGALIGVTMILIGLLSLTAFAGYYTPLSPVTAVTGWIYQNFYGPVQTAVRLALAAWLWRESLRGARLISQV